MQHHYPVFTITPQGVMVDGMPLNKAVSSHISPYAQGYIRRIEELLKRVKPEDWNNRRPCVPGEVRPLVQAHMLAALASPQPFPSPLHKYSPDQPRDWHGRWTDEGGDASTQEEKAEDSDGANSNANAVAQLVPGDAQWLQCHERCLDVAMSSGYRDTFGRYRMCMRACLGSFGYENY